MARALRQARDGRPIQVEDVAAFVADVREGMRADFRDSRDDLARRTGRFKDHVRFQEHEEDPADSSPRRREAWREVADEVEKGLSNFFRSRLYRQLRALAPSDWIEIEDSRLPPASIELSGVKVYVKLDCAFRADGKAVVVDWKTGRRLTESGPVQLATYALYLSQRHGVAPEDVVAREVNVVTGDVAEHDVGPAALDAFTTVFAESVARMRSYLVDVAGNVARPAGEFPFTEDDRNCRYCRFKSICPKVAAAF